MLARVLASLVAAALALAARAGRADDGTPVALDAGTSLNLCKSGLAACVAAQVICDDPKVARIENGPGGPELKGISPGSTLCSVSGAGGAFRRVLRVTVRPPQPRGT